MKKLILLLSFITTSSIAQTNFWEHTNGPPDGNVVSLAIDNGNIFAGTSGSSRGIFRSTDNGDNWSEINTGLTNNVIFDLSVNSSGDIFAGTGGGVFRSTDNGDNWSEINSGLTNTTVFALTINNSDDIFAGTFSGNGGVFRSSNNGSTWSQVGLIGVFIYGLAINDNGDIFAGTFAGVWRSSDNGNTWSQKIIGLTNMDVVDFAFNSSGDIFAGTNGGMFRSSNNGDNWTAINNGLTSTDAWSCASNSRDDIFAGTLSGGVFHSGDNGDSWSAINSGLTNTAVRALAINSSDQIFAGSGDGVSRSTAISEPKVDIFVVTNPNDSGTGSLRQALLDANGQAGTDTIQFNIPGAGPHTIQPNSALPTITDPVIIDGYTQAGASPNTNPTTQGSNAVLMIELNGANAGAGVNGLIIVAGSSTVRGLAINRFVQGGGRTGEGIHLSTNGGNVIEGNFLGTDITGTSALGGSGVRILSGSGNTIGGTAPAARNIISGNAYGIVMDGNASGNLVQGNFIGIDATGTVALGNQLDGIAIAGDDNTIGGTTLDARNVISGNVRRGVHLSFRSQNVVQGNFIGTDVNGQVTSLGNKGGGVLIFRSGHNTIGGTAVEAGNLIAGNAYTGVAILSETVPSVGVQAKGNRVLSNSIFSNAWLGIDLGPNNVYGGDGVTTNDAGDSDNGANKLQNFPEISTAGVLDNNHLVVKYKVDSAPNNAAYPMTIQFFAADAGGEGMTFLGEDTYWRQNWSRGDKFVTFANVAGSQFNANNPIVATATDINGNTSEFSPMEAPTTFASSTIDQVYEAIQQENLQIDKNSYIAGEEVRGTFDLVNRSGSSLVIPLNLNYSRPFHLVGVHQRWIERLGPDSNIPSIPSVIARDGPRYAAGGQIIVTDPLWPASEIRTRFWQLSHTTNEFPSGTYRIYIEYKRLDATIIKTDTVEFVLENTTSVEESLQSPEVFTLFQNYPNPFNPETEIRFQLPEASHVVLRIFNTLGQEIRTLVDSPYVVGSHSIRWDGKDNRGNLVATGIYLYQLQAGSFSQNRKMTLLR